MASSMEVEEFYEHQRAIGLVWGVTLKPWGLLSWEEQIDWQDRLNEQLSRDKEDHHPR